MNKDRFLTFLTVALSMVMLITFTIPTTALKVPRITKEELKSMLDTTDVVIIDVRFAKQWKNSERKIKGAVREGSEEVESWANKYPKEKPLVVYSAWPDEAASARVVRQLMERGFTKVYALKGGWKEWIRPRYPTECK